MQICILKQYLRCITVYIVHSVLYLKFLGHISGQKSMVNFSASLIHVDIEYMVNYYGFRIKKYSIH